MGEEGSAAVGRECERRAAKENSSNGVFIWGKEPHTKTAHLKRRAQGHEGMNSNGLEPSSAI